MSEERIIENYQVFTMEHQIRIEGHHLLEKKQKIKSGIKSDFRGDKTIISIHIRSIDDKYIKVKEIKHGESDIPERKVEMEPEMSEDEVKEFVEQWSRLWTPSLNTRGQLENQPQEPEVEPIENQPQEPEVEPIENQPQELEEDCKCLGCRRRCQELEIGTVESTENKPQ